jgi:transglycosylase-like protein with SLT domain
MSNDPTSPVPGDPNSILFNFQPSGASNGTAKQDKLPQKGITGVAASRAMAEFDSKRVLKHKDKFIAAGQQFDIPPALLAAIASRESRGGAVLKNGFGDHGFGFGIMQVDKRSHVLQGTNDPASVEHINQATGILRASIDQVRHNHPDWSPERQMQGGIAGYNKGASKVKSLDKIDAGTTGNDYSNDVWARAQLYAEKMGAVSPALAVTASASSTFPTEGE